MGKLWKIVGAMLLVLGACGLGYSQYMSHEQRGQTTDMATNAISAVATAASRMTADKTVYTITVATRVGQGRVDDRDIPMAVVATISLRGSSALADMCVSVPRVRDTVNAVIVDHIGSILRSGRPILPDDLVADEANVRTALNRLVQGEAVSDAHLVLKSAFGVQDAGCTEGTRTANAKGPARH